MRLILNGYLNQHHKRKSCLCGWINPLTPNDHYSGRTASLTSKSCILYIYSTNTGTEYFKRGIYSPCFSLQNAVYFILLTYLVPVLFTFYIQGVLKLKKKKSSAKRLRAECIQDTPEEPLASIMDAAARNNTRTLHARHKRTVVHGGIFGQL